MHLPTEVTEIFQLNLSSWFTPSSWGGPLVQFSVWPNGLLDISQGKLLADHHHHHHRVARP